VRALFVAVVVEKRRPEGEDRVVVFFRNAVEEHPRDQSQDLGGERMSQDKG
jgi:hypothetical protein